MKEGQRGVKLKIRTCDELPDPAAHSVRGSWPFCGVGIAGRRGGTHRAVLHGAESAPLLRRAAGT